MKNMSELNGSYYGHGHDYGDVDDVVDSGPILNENHVGINGGDGSDEVQINDANDGVGGIPNYIVAAVNDDANANASGDDTNDHRNISIQEIHPDELLPLRTLAANLLSQGAYPAIFDPIRDVDYIVCNYMVRKWEDDTGRVTALNLGVIIVSMDIPEGGSLRQPVQDWNGPLSINEFPRVKSLGLGLGCKSIPFTTATNSPMLEELRFHLDPTVQRVPMFISDAPSRKSEYQHVTKIYFIEAYRAQNDAIEAQGHDNRTAFQSGVYQLLESVSYICPNVETIGIFHSREAIVVPVIDFLVDGKRYHRFALERCHDIQLIGCSMAEDEDVLQKLFVESPQLQSECTCYHVFYQNTSLTSLQRIAQSVQSRFVGCGGCKWKKIPIALSLEGCPVWNIITQPADHADFEAWSGLRPNSPDAHERKRKEVKALAMILKELLVFSLGNHDLSTYPPQLQLALRLNLARLSLSVLSRKKHLTWGKILYTLYEKSDANRSGSYDATALFLYIRNHPTLIGKIGRRNNKKDTE